MGKLIDLSGQKFGKLTVMYKNSKRTKSGILSTYWHCKCECGRECDKDSAGLRSGKYISCGICTPRKIRKDADDLTGKRFGRLTVIEVDMEKREDTFKNKKLGSLYWKCKCDCGNEISVKGSHLKNGSTISCGCYQKELAKTVIPKSNWKTNKIIESDECILIKSSNTEDYFIIDSEDYDKVKNYCWCNSHGYAVSTIRGEKNKFVGMHRIIMNCGENENLLVVDHINHNTLDNRKSNLRIATDMQNNWNSIRNHNSGIQYNSILEKWNVTIKYNLQDINLGLFDSYNEALDIRDKAEKVFFEEFQYNDKKEGDEYKYKNFNKS